jgi:hypothetical protein
MSSSIAKMNAAADLHAFTIAQGQVIRNKAQRGQTVQDASFFDNQHAAPSRLACQGGPTLQYRPIL